MKIYHSSSGANGQHFLLVAIVKALGKHLQSNVRKMSSIAAQVRVDIVDWLLIKRLAMTWIAAKLSRCNSGSRNDDDDNYKKDQSAEFELQVQWFKTRLLRRSKKTRLILSELQLETRLQVVAYQISSEVARSWLLLTCRRLKLDFMQLMRLGTCRVLFVPMDFDDFCRSF